MILFILLLNTIFGSEVEMVFPNNSQSYYDFQWISCETGELLTPITLNGAQQYQLTQSEGLCSSPNNKFILEGQNTLLYSFIFSDTISSIQNLSIFLDGKRYNITASYASEADRIAKHATIQHKHFESCLNSIDIILESNQTVNLVYFYIRKQSKKTKIKDQQIYISPILGLNEQSQDCFQLRTISHSIKNNIYHYAAALNQSTCTEEGLITKRIYINEQIVTPQSVRTGEQQYIAIVEVALNENIVQQLNYLPFLLKSVLRIEYWWLGTIEPKMNSQNFSIISQVDQNNNTLGPIIWQKTYIDGILNLENDLEINMTESFANIKITPKSYPKCEYELSFAQIVFFKENDYNYQECDLFSSNITCLTYSNDNCTFTFYGQFNNNEQYQFNLTAQINGTQPKVQFSVKNQIVSKTQSQNYHIGTSIAMFVILSLFVSPIIVLLYYCYFKPQYYIIKAYFLASTNEDD